MRKIVEALEECGDIVSVELNCIDVFIIEGLNEAVGKNALAKIDELKRGSKMCLGKFIFIIQALTA